MAANQGHGRCRPRLLPAAVPRLEGERGRRHHEGERCDSLLADLRSDAGSRTRPVGRPHRDRRLPRQSRHFRQGDRRLLRGVRRPERAGLCRLSHRRGDRTLAGPDRRVMPVRKGWMAIAGAVACVAVLGIVIAVTARGTVLDEGFLPSTLERTHTIERVYDEVLVDKAVTRVTNDLTSGLPAQASVTAAVGVNVRLVIPPDALRATIARLSADTVRWFRGDVD